MLQTKLNNVQLNNSYYTMQVRYYYYYASSISDVYGNAWENYQFRY